MWIGLSMLFRSFRSFWGFETTVEAEPEGSAGRTQNLIGGGGFDAASYLGSAPVKTNLTTRFSRS
jgi:hypothetical protein